MSLAKELLQNTYPATYRETEARANFNEARNHAISLIRIHDSLTGGAVGRPDGEYEALKKSALILAVTAWESFVEGTVKEQMEILLNSVSDPRSNARVSKIFNAAAEEWIGPNAEPKPKPTDAADWTGDGWKARIAASLDSHLKTFHSPTTENTEKLFRRFLGLKNFPDNWHWQSVGYAAAQKKLNDLIKLRGEAVHEGKRKIAPRSGTSPAKTGRKVVINALNLIQSLVVSTEKALDVAPSALPAAPSS